MKRLFCAALVTALLLCAMCVGLAESAVLTVDQVEKHGNIYLACTGKEFLALGYQYGDIVTVRLNGQDYDMPVCSQYSDVDSGSMVCRVTEPRVILAINMRDMATACGLAVKHVDADGAVSWTYSEGIEEPVTATFTMKEPAGYLDEYKIRQLVRSNDRADYPLLSDEAFANFRMVATTGMGKGVLYRTSSPIENDMGRAVYALTAMEQSGVRTVMNLTNHQAEAEALAGYAESYYARQDVIFLNLSVNFAGDDFRAGLADGLRWFAGHDAPYLVHCHEGKDRAGFVSAVLECLLGASMDEVIADYMTSYCNYYRVRVGSEQYDTIAASNICKSLAAAFETEDLMNADLRAEAREYILALGLTENEIDALVTKLGSDLE